MYCPDPYPPETIKEIKLDIAESRRKYAEEKAKAEAKLASLLKEDYPTNDACTARLWLSKAQEQDDMLLFLCREENKLDFLEEFMETSEEGLSEEKAMQILEGKGVARFLTLAWDTVRRDTDFEKIVCSCCDYCQLFMEDMVVGRRLPACTHAFHSRCLYEWFIGKFDTIYCSSCPICLDNKRLLRTIPTNYTPFHKVSQIEGGRRRTLPYVFAY